MSDEDSRGYGESLLWALVLLVGPAGLVWEFGLSIIHTLPLSENLPIRFIEHIEVAMYTLVIVLGGGTLLAFIYAAIRYSDEFKRAPDAMSVNWAQRSFIAWIAVIIAVLLITATVGATTLMTVDSGPAPPDSAGNQIDTEEALTYKVVGVQWTWMVKPVQPNHLGFAMRREIRVPANTTIHLEITSKDVIHSFAIQELGVKKDAVPGQVNHYWFVAQEPGRYQINCAELCGAGHSQMTPTLVVMPREEYGQWVVEQGGTNPFKSTQQSQMNATTANTTAGTENRTATTGMQAGNATTGPQNGTATTEKTADEGDNATAGANSLGRHPTAVNTIATERRGIDAG
ncbi:cytochrome c oxidase subunit II [Natrinema caseinilyticum]|uniref:cytochrome c oxidase subunit II n=1 Tax=Natrinema caseinilyticum TaxID=2961570 RepID=UPI0020C22EE1|nr:cytochrome c oxidase subunit II [Natrinema caseinilyticum]